MRQILQSLGTGELELAEVPCPAAREGQLLIRTTRSLVSAGTERMLVEFGRAGWIEKARQQPEKVRQVLDKVATDGLRATLDAVRGKLDQPIPLGYSNVGVVAGIGGGSDGFSLGDRVVSNGAHAEIVCVPKNLCARVPASVSDEAAAFTVLGAIALQSLRLAAPTLGERFVVIGLGLIGLITVQLLRANGCRVLGVDPDPRKADLARSFGADVVQLDRDEDPLAVANDYSDRRGVDGVIIAAATDSNEPVRQAAQMCRKRGRIVLVGVAGLELNRADFYRKELSFQVSCSYGPGRYDPQYEEAGHDYPLGFVRWTEQRNLEAVLEMLASGRLDVAPLITHRFAFDSAADAYELLSGAREPYLGIVLEYAGPAASVEPRTVRARDVAPRASAGGAPRLGFIGAGNYARRMLIPSFARAGAELVAVASAGGVTAAHCAKKFGFARATTDADAVLGAADVDAVVIATRHDTHARFVVHALELRKHVFVEKPLALTLAEVDAIATAWEASGPEDARPLVMVGFNRRFAPLVEKMRVLLAGVREPKSFVVTVNAGAVPADHWTQDPAVGGGRIVGEACHFIDLLRFLAASPIADARLVGAAARNGGGPVDSVTLALAFEDGSLGTIHYLANGHRSFPKERVEAFCAGRVLQLDNFRRLSGYGWPRFARSSSWRQDKGQSECARRTVEAMRGNASAPIPFAEIVETSRAAIVLGEAARR